MSTDRLQPETRSTDTHPVVQAETAAETPIFMPLEIELDPLLMPGAEDSWLEVIRYWVAELRWWRHYWGSGPR